MNIMDNLNLIIFKVKANINQYNQDTCLMDNGKKVCIYVFLFINSISILF